MSFENFDNKVREAAEQHSASFDEGSWNKMQTLLDEHLPNDKKDYRRFLIILFIVLLLGGGSFVLFNNPATVEPVSKNTEQTNLPSLSKETSSISQDATISTQRTRSLDGTQSTVNNFTEPIVNAGQKTNLINKASASFKTTPASLSKAPVQKEMSVSNDQNIPPEQEKEQLVIDKPAANVLAPVDNDKKPSPEIPLKADTAPAAKSTDKKKKNQHAFTQLAITLSAGPDFSMVGFDNPGKVQLAYGAGLSYPLSKKLSIRTGFYVARKIYSAAPKDYDPPKDFWSWYPNLKNIDANCRVFEIPVILDYQLGKRQQWFLSSGISSIIMKQEDYAYTYRPPYSSQDVTYSRTHKNENDHIFSMLHLSGGYSYPVSKRISLRAEPYVKIPLTGIGYGKIKLNSGGLMVTVAVLPFASNK